MDDFASSSSTSSIVLFADFDSANMAKYEKVARAVNVPATAPTTTATTTNMSSNNNSTSTLNSQSSKNLASNATGT
jgi:hypothetical protein